jgi:hypothetical protein
MKETAFSAHETEFEIKSDFMESLVTTTASRDLTGAERSLIAALLQHVPQDRKRYRAQLHLVKVVGECDCGCPSVDLSLGGGFERSWSAGTPSPQGERRSR